jgi:hypothetical protein
VFTRRVVRLRDCDDQLEQIELEKARLEEAVHDDQDITEALEELREQLSATKKERLAQLQLVEQAERALATELGVALDSSGPAASGRGDSVGVGLGGTSGAGGGPGLDANTVAFVRSVTGLWRKLEASSIEKLNIGQQETLCASCRERPCSPAACLQTLVLARSSLVAVACETCSSSPTSRSTGLRVNSSGSAPPP